MRETRMVRGMVGVMPTLLEQHHGGNTYGGFAPLVLPRAGSLAGLSVLLELLRFAPSTSQSYHHRWRGPR